MDFRGKAVFLGFRHGERRTIGYPNDWRKIEVGRFLFAYSPALDCPDCDGCGCKSCKFTGFHKGQEPDWNVLSGGRIDA